MFYTVLYIILAALGSLAVYGLLIRLAPQLRRKRGLLLVLCLALPFAPYGIVSAQTALFGPSLRAAVKQAYTDCGGMCGDEHDTVRRFEVLQITPRTSKIYIVTDCHDSRGHAAGRCGAVIAFTRPRDRWRYVGFDTPWSDCGSAEGNVFPPDPQAKSF